VIAELRPTILPDGRQVTAIYIGRRLMATLTFSAPNNETAEAVCEAIADLYEESQDQ